MLTLERVLTERVLRKTSPPTILLAVRLEKTAVSTVVLRAVRVLVSIVEFTVIVLVTKDAKEIPDTERVLADRVLKTAFGPVTVLIVSVERTVSPLLESVLKVPAAPVRLLSVIVLAKNVLVARVLIDACPPIIVLTVSVLMAAVAVVRLGRARVLVARVLKVAFVPVSVLI